MKRLKRIALAASLLILSVAPATTEEVNDHDRFSLWTGCRGMGIEITNSRQYADKLGLTEDDIETTVRHRLRLARLYKPHTDTQSWFLGASVTLQPPAFLASIYFFKLLADPLTGKTDFAPTWEFHDQGFYVAFRTVGDRLDALGDDERRSATIAAILNKLSAGTDRFIEQFWRVNEAECQKVK